MSDSPKVEMLDPRAGRTSQAVHIAVQELIRRKLDPVAYGVRVMRIGAELTIIFSDKNVRPDPNVLGSPGKAPGFEVVLDEKTHEVKKSYFVR